MNKVFHKGYFWEMFRQLKIAGIVAAAILMLTNVSSALTVIPGFLSFDGTTTSIPGGYELALPMMTYVYVAGLVFTFIAFNWLNRRSYSDFYHSLPLTRKQIYGSSVLAILTWMIIGLSAHAFVRAFISFVFGAPFNYLLYLCVYLNMVIGAIEVVGAVSIACAISGTRFVNVFASIVILFVPRFLLYVMGIFIEQSSPIMLNGVSNTSLLLDPSYNIIASPYAPIVASISGYNVSIDYAKLPAMLWSLCYSSVLIVLGGIAFNKRLSETAGLPTKSRLFQAAVRTAIGLPLLLILMFLIVTEDAMLVPAVLLVMFSFIFYCLYELISTKSPKKMAKAMPLWFICLGISLLYLVVPKLVNKAEMSVKVSEDKVKGIYLVSDSNDGFFERLVYGSGDNGYSDILRDEIEITDAESIRIISDAYNRNISWENDHYEMSDNYSWSWIKVKIVRSNGRDIVRNIYLTNVELRRLGDLADQNREYYNAGVEFPKGLKYFSVSGLSQREAKELGKLYEEEYNALSDSDKISLRSYAGNVYGMDYDMIDPSEPGRFSMSMGVCGCIGAKNYQDAYYINSLTPRTLSRYIELVNSRNGEDGKVMLDEIKSWFETGGHNDMQTYSVRIAAFAEIGYYDSRYMMSEVEGMNNGVLPKDSDPELYEMIRILSNAPLTTDHAQAVQIRAYVWHPDDSRNDSTKTFFVKLSDEEIMRLFELYNTHESNMFSDDKIIDYDEGI